MPFDHSEHHDDRPERGGDAGAADATSVEGSDVEGSDPERGAGPADDSAGSPVVVRRHAGIAALIGAAASAVAIAYLWRAVASMAVLDWTLFGVMAVIAGYYLASLVDARTPLLVADDLGVRIRLGHEWRGLPWDAIGQVVVHPRRGVLRDGRIVFVPRSLARALDGLDARSRRHVALNQKMYGAPLAVPVGMTTRVAGSGERAVTEELAALMRGRADVVELDPKTLEVVDPDARAAAVAATDRAADADGPTSRTWAIPAPDASTNGAQTAHMNDRGPQADRADADRADADRADGERVATGNEAQLAPDALPGRETGRETGSETGRETGGETGRETGGETGRETGLAPGAEPDSDVAVDPAARVPRRSILGGIGTIVSRVAKGRAHDVDAARLAPSVETDPTAATAQATVGPDVPGADLPATPASRPAPAAALRETRPGLRAEATLDLPTAGSNALDPAHDETRTAVPGGRELRRPGNVDLVFERVEVDDRVRPISTLGDPVAPLVIDDYVTEPAYDPVIGPELTAARTRLGLSVDDLAERTRIRPHVIESIEVDDFAPCGGDFYARGHLRTLARILGKDAEPMLAAFEQRYATAPINARRVFEAELATGMTGSMRSTVGGPSWGLLVGVVLSLVLVWGVVRLFTTEPVEMVEVPAPVLNGSAGVDNGYLVAPAPARPAADPIGVRLTASQADTQVVVRDGQGKVVFSGQLVLGERKTLQVAPPVSIRAADGGAVEVRVAGRDRGPLGVAGEPARRTFG